MVRVTEAMPWRCPRRIVQSVVRTRGGHDPARSSGVLHLDECKAVYTYCLGKGLIGAEKIRGPECINNPDNRQSCSCDL